MSKKLFVFSGDWADEIDVYSYAIVDTEDALWADYQNIKNAPKAKLEEKGTGVCIAIGSNEAIDYDTAQDLFDELTVKNITEEEAFVITKKLGKEWGNPDIDYIIESLTEVLFGEEDDDDDDEEDDF